MEWYKRNVDDALVGKLGLTLEERGAYDTLLDLIYQKDNKLKDNPDICKWLGCDPRVWRRLRGRLIELEKIYIADGFICNKRATKEIRRVIDTPQVDGKLGPIYPPSLGSKSNKSPHLAKKNEPKTGDRLSDTKNTDKPLTPFSGDEAPSTQARKRRYLHEEFPSCQNAEHFCSRLPGPWREVLNRYVEEQFRTPFAAGFWERWVGKFAGELEGDDYRRQNWLWTFQHAAEATAQKTRNSASRRGLQRFP